MKDSRFIVKPTVDCSGVSQRQSRMERGTYFKRCRRRLDPSPSRSQATLEDIVLPG